MLYGVLENHRVFRHTACAILLPQQLLKLEATIAIAACDTVQLYYHCYCKLLTATAITSLLLLQALADFLEQKRSALPRFYFIGDDDLLEILGQAKNPTVIQEHLKKLFQGTSYRNTSMFTVFALRP
jgi:Dynein heavy chain, N-terminal region 2